MIPKNKVLIFIICSIGFGIITLLLAVKLSPWFYAINSRVRLYLEAPAETKLFICWDKSQSQCLPLIPYSRLSNRIAEPGEIADVWLSELPPRPVYSISLIFKSSFKDVTFHELELDSSDVLLYGKVQGAGVRNIHLNIEQFTLNGISSVTNRLQNLDSATRTQLTLNRDIIPGPPGVSKHWRIVTVWVILYSIYLLIGLPIYLLPQAINNLGNANQAPHVSKYSWWMYPLCAIAILVMLLLVVNSGVLFNEFDSLNYLSLSLSGKGFSDTRLPGYPLFIRLALRTFSYDLDGVILLQASLLALSTLTCVWVLRKWIPRWIAILFVLLCIFSPAQIHWARWLLRESLFTSILLLGVTATIAHFVNQSKLWLYIFTATCGFAFLVRENGILLPVALFSVLLPKSVECLRSSGTIGDRLKCFFSLVTRYLSPVITLAIIYLAFCTYNYIHYGYFQIGIHQTSHSYLARTIYPGNSDARSLLEPTSSVSEDAIPYHGWHLYSSFIIARDQIPRLDPVYMALYPSVSRQISDHGYAVNTFYLSSILNEMGKGIYSMVPKRANLSGLIRQYTEIISMNTNSIYPLNVETPHTKVSRQELLDRLPVKVNYDEKTIDANGILASYYSVTQFYQWYSFLFLLALLFSLYILKYEDPVFLAPMTIFIANCVLLIVTRLVDARYLVSLDVLLILQLILGLSLWMNKNYSHKRFLAQLNVFGIQESK